jgi:hypothetical protein
MKKALIIRGEKCPKNGKSDCNKFIDINRKFVVGTAIFFYDKLICKREKK